MNITANQEAISVLKTVIARACPPVSFASPVRRSIGLEGWTQMDVPLGGSKFSEVPGFPRRSGQRVRQPPSAQPRQVHTEQEVMGDSQGPVVECMKLELEKARNGENVEVEECRKFIIRPEKRISELDAERESQVMALDEAKETIATVGSRAGGSSF